VSKSYESLFIPRANPLLLMPAFPAIDLDPDIDWLASMCRHWATPPQYDPVLSHDDIRLILKALSTQLYNINDDEDK